MKRIVDANQMRCCERIAADNGLNEDILIENAASALNGEIFWLFKRGAVCIFAGSGNNAADGLSLARLLLSSGKRVFVVQTADNLNAFAAARLNAFKAAGGRVLNIKEVNETTLSGVGVIVDAVFGIGLARNVEGEQARAVRLMNDSRAVVVSVDIPSGLNADDGSVMGCAVSADVTVTFGAYKRGHFLGKGADLCGDIQLYNLSIPVSTGAVLCEDNVPALPRRKKASHKGDYGRVMIIGGSPAMTGAPLIAGNAAMRAGAGLTSLCVADSLAAAYQARVCEATLRLLPSDKGMICFDKQALDDCMEKADSIALGMGMGNNAQLSDIINYIAHSFKGTLIIDADGLNALAGNLQILDGHCCKLILTPHSKEFNRLFGAQEGIQGGVIERTQQAAQRLNAVIAHKSNVTVITDGSTAYINSTGSPAMAKGGSGDALSGIIAAYAVRLSPLEAAARAAYEAGRAAQKAAQQLGEDAVLVSDSAKFIKRLP